MKSGRTTSTSRSVCGRPCAELIPLNFIYLWNGGPEEGVVQVQLKPSATPVGEASARNGSASVFAAQLPDVSFSFEPSDIVSRVMSLGASTPIEVAVSGPNLAANREFAEKVREQLQKIPLCAIVQFGQALDYPTVDVAVNRERAGLMGVKMADVSRSLVDSHLLQPLCRSRIIGRTRTAASLTRFRSKFRNSG